MITEEEKKTLKEEVESGKISVSSVNIFDDDGNPWIVKRLSQLRGHSSMGFSDVSDLKEALCRSSEPSHQIFFAQRDVEIFKDTVKNW